MMIDCGYTRVKPEWRVDEHTAPGFVRIYQIHDGDVWFTEEQGRKKLPPGKIYLFPSAVPFSIAHDPAHPLLCTFLHLDVFPIVVRELTELPLEKGGFIEALFASLQAAIRRESRSIVASLSETLELYCKEKGLLQMPVTEIASALDYIAANVSHHAISIGELSARSGYNPQYFIRLFRRSMGMTPHQYITTYRLNESVKLLRQGNLSVTQIAERVGYADIKTFGRAFRGRYGVSATQFQKIEQQIP